MGRIRENFKGCYGFDTLSGVLLLITVLLDLINLLPASKGNQIWGIVALFPLFLCILRIFSKNIPLRTKENQILLRIMSLFIKNSEGRTNASKAEKKLFKFFKCPQCGQRVRVPKGKGKVEILCPKCAAKFVKKT